MGKEVNVRIIASTRVEAYIFYGHRHHHKAENRGEDAIKITARKRRCVPEYKGSNLCAQQPAALLQHFRGDKHSPRADERRGYKAVP